jgi:hypothetical protein
MRKISPGKSLIDDQHAWAVDAISPIERPPVEDRDAHGRKVPATDQRALRWQGARRVSTANVLLRPEASSAGGTSERQKLHRPDRLHAWHGFYSIENLVEGRNSRLRRSHAQEQSHRNGVGRLKAQIDPEQARERAEKQPRAHEQHERQRDLRHNEHISNPMVTTIGRATARALLQRIVWIGTTRVSCGHQAKGERCGAGDDERKQQACRIEADRHGGSPRQCTGGQRDQSLRGPQGDHEPGGAAARRQHEALEQELSDETSAAGAKRRAERQLAAPGNAACHQEPRQIHAGDSQHRRHHRHQQPQAGACLSDQILVQA